MGSIRNGKYRKFQGVFLHRAVEEGSTISGVNGSRESFFKMGEIACFYVNESNLVERGKCDTV